MEPFDSNWLFASILLATPLIYAAMGELVSQRAGVMNIGLEGMMLTGAFFGYLVADKAGSIPLGLLASVAGGMALGGIMAVLTVRLFADQIITGVGINILAFGLTAYLLSEVYPGGETPTLDRPGTIAVPLLSDIPFVGSALFDQGMLVYGAYLLVPLVWIALYRTRRGLSLRAAGELPEAVDSAGASAMRQRVVGTLVAGGLAGLGGAFLSIGEIGLFKDQMASGRGFLAFAAVIFGAWRPAGVLAACLVFGAADALQLRLQSEVSVPPSVWWLVGLAVLGYVALLVVSRRRSGRPASSRSTVHLAAGAVAVAGAVALIVIRPDWSLPAQVWLALPYVLTLVALAGFVGRSRAPRALGLPYRPLDA